MSIRRINLTGLLINNVRIIPSRLIINYRYISNQSSLLIAKISVMVSIVDGNPVNICNMMDLFKPTESEHGVGKFTTGIITLPTDKVATGIYLEIYNAEYVSIENVSISQLQSGTQPNGTQAISQEVLRIDSFVINDGSIFSPTQSVVLNNTCIGSPTHYRASMYSNFIDALWMPYSSNPQFELYTIGVNAIYLQVKNSTSISDVISRQIAWHGVEECVVHEPVVIGSINVTDSFNQLITSRHNIMSIEEMVVVDSVSVNEQVEISLTGVQ